MKILAPLSSLKEVNSIIKAGADEIYCGIIDEQLNSKYKIPAVNRRPYSIWNLNSFNELKEVVKKSHYKGIPVYVTLNDTVCTNDQYGFIEENLERFSKFRVDAVIVSDVGLMQFIKEKKYRFSVHVSTCASTYNSEAVNLYKDMGASRIILPRHMTTDEINDLKSKNEDLEYELLILNANCQYDDGYCTYEHSLGSYTKDSAYGGAGCGSIQNMEYIYRKEEYKDKKLPDIIGEYKKRKSTFISTCGVCRLANLNLTDKDALKIVGREFVLSRKEKDIKFLYKVRELIKSCSDKDIIIKATKGFYKEIYGKECNDKCYY